jgi:hypothetical protein
MTTGIKKKRKYDLSDNIIIFLQKEVKPTL